VESDVDGKNSRRLLCQVIKAGIMKAEDPSVSFTGEFSPNFVLKNMISTTQKIFHEKK
jgi:hypothetical protein